MGPSLEFGIDAREIAVGLWHACAVLADESVRCWGDNALGQLGVVSTETVGDDEAPVDFPNVDLGGVALRALVAGDNHTCAITTNDRALCWGANARGQLGHGHTRAIGDDETPASSGFVPLTPL
jgi:alpha-tubulin suppressor-like RCC1 family protein